MVEVKKSAVLEKPIMNLTTVSSILKTIHKKNSVNKEDLNRILQLSGDD